MSLKRNNQIHQRNKLESLSLLVSLKKSILNNQRQYFNVDLGVRLHKKYYENEIEWRTKKNKTKMRNQIYKNPCNLQFNQQYLKLQTFQLQLQEHLDMVSKILKMTLHRSILTMRIGKRMRSKRVKIMKKFILIMTKSNLWKLKTLLTCEGSLLPSNHEKRLFNLLLRMIWSLKQLMMTQWIYETRFWKKRHDCRNKNILQQRTRAKNLKIFKHQQMKVWRNQWNHDLDWSNQKIYESDEISTSWKRKLPERMLRKLLQL